MVVAGQVGGAAEAEGWTAGECAGRQEGRQVDGKVGDWADASAEM